MRQIELELQNEALRRAQAPYLDFYERAPVGYCTLCASGGIREANGAATKLLGLARGELIGQPLSRCILGEDQEVFDRFLQALFEAPTHSAADFGSAGGPAVCTVRLRQPDGANLWARLEAIAASDAEGSPIGRVTLSDVTPSQQVEALQVSLDHYKSILEDTLDWQSWFDLDGRYLWVNPAVEQLTGYTPEEVMAMPDWVSVLIAEEDWPIFAETFGDAIRGSHGTGFEIRYVRKDGMKRWISVDWKPVVDAQGKPLGTRASGRDITDLKLTEEALRRSQSLLARTEAIAHVGSWDWDLATDTLTWSDELFRLFQRDPAEGPPAFADHLRRYSPEDRARLSDAMQAALTEGRSYELELSTRLEDGALQVSRTVGHADIDRQGRVIRLFGFVQDITERRAADRALRDSEELFHAMFINAPLNILIHDADTGEMLDANPAACALYGYDSVEALKSASPELWLEPPYSVDDAVRWAAKTLREGPQQFEWHYRCANGERIWEWVHLSTIMMQGKHHILAMTVDITEDKQIKADLQSSEARARAIIDASPVPFALNDTQQNINYLNSAFIELFGYTLADIPTLADWWSRAYPDPDYRQAIIANWWEGMARARREGGRFEPLEAVIRCKNGQVRTVVARASALGRSFEDLHLVSLYDITDLKQAQEQAEQAARVKAEFLANMSHEIRTPLNAMLGLAQLLESEALSADQRHLLQRLRTAGRSLLALVNDILDLSKLAAGQLRLTARTFAPAAVLAQVASLLGQEARSKGLAFQLDTPVDLAAWLRGDSLRLEQILINLVGNAVKFTERGEVRIQISQEDIDTAAVRLRLEVRDTGIGIAPEHLAHLGTAFTQVDGSITRRFGGTGLGLAISKELVERMDGTFGIDSTLGVGSTFWCELPFARASADATPSDAVAPPARPSGPRLSAVHCLVADDCPLNREVVERALRREGARATLVADGRQALDWLRAKPEDVDAVLMDIQMPVMDGLTATRAIRQELGLTELPVIAFSASVLAEQRQRAQEAGVNDFLTKPVDLEDLVAMLQRWRAAPASDASAPNAILARASGETAGTDFPDIPGLDTRQAARLLGNDWSLFVKLLPQLTGDFLDAAQRTRDDLARGACSDAARRLHSLQGRAGYLGARDLVRTSQTLEQGLLEGRTDLQDVMDAFEGQLAALLAALTPWLAQPKPSVADGDAVLDPRQLAALHAALVSCDLAALGLFERLEPALVRRDGHAATAAVAERIRSLRFEEALALLAPEPHPG
ncbi:PAS domain S-box protein [Thiocystis violacea]|uniref:PAS domain S-box protein n=1 Tax=Thiocystis violacea TaxID=13725 RepID=UPI001902D590